MAALAQNLILGRARREISGDSLVSGSVASALTVPGQYDLTVFYHPSCSACLEAKPIIESDVASRPRIQVRWIDTDDDPDGSSRIEQQMLDARQVPQDAPRPLPILFVGNDWLAGPGAVRSRLAATLDRYLKGGSPPPGPEGVPWADALRAAFRWICLLPLLLAVALGSLGGRDRRFLASSGVALYTTLWLAGSGLLRPLFAKPDFGGLRQAFYPIMSAAGFAVAAVLWRRRSASISRIIAPDADPERPSSGYREGGAGPAVLAPPRFDRERRIALAEPASMTTGEAVVATAGALSVGIAAGLALFPTIGGDGLDPLLYHVRTGPDRLGPAISLACYLLLFLAPSAAAGFFASRIPRRSPLAAAALAVIGAALLIESLVGYGLL